MIRSTPLLFHTRAQAICVLGLLAIWMSGCSSLPQQAVLDENQQYILVNFLEPKPLNPWATSDSYSYRETSHYRSPQMQRAIRNLASDYRFQQVDDWPIKSLGLYCVLYALAPDQDLNTVLSQLSADERVGFVEPMVEFAVLTTEDHGYSDPLVSMQYPESADLLAGFHEMSTGKGTRIGIIDSGVDGKHPDLRGRVHQSHELLNNLLLPAPAHGTAVAGVIGALADNEEGIVGLAPDATLYTYEACGERNGKTICTSFTLAKALEYALEDNLDVVNMSLAGKETPLLRALIDQLQDRGTIVVAATDPEGRNTFPANLAQVHSAGPSHDEHYWFAKSERLSTIAGGGYRYFFGSSMSAAGITGFAAMLTELYPSKDVSRILKALSDPNCANTISKVSAQISDWIKEPESTRCLSLNTFTSTSFNY